MYLAWAVGLLFVVVAVAYFVRHRRETARAGELAEVQRAERQRVAEFAPPHTEGEGDEDTAPAVLTPPEWTVPKNSSAGSARRR
jgi:uncharacterized membrane protein